MAVFLLLLFLFSVHEVEAQQHNFNISRGSSLSPTSNSSWLSPSGMYGFGFYREGDGFAVGIFVAGMPEKTLVWTANRDQDQRIVPSNATLLLTTDGRLILQAQGREMDIASSAESIASASMLNSGNFVLYNSDQKITWQSFDQPTDTLLPGQRLSANQQLVSRASETDYSSGIFRLKMQDDGNLVQYPIGTTDDWHYAYYSSSTDGRGNNVTLNLEDNGHLYLYNSTHNIRNITPGWEDNNSTTIYLMRLDIDGVFRVYSLSLEKGNITKVWSPTYDGCAPKGICGLNAFCTLMDQQVSCQCVPGFDFISKEKQGSGCERNFTESSCKSIDPTVSYAMRRSPYTVWENTPYAVLKINTAEDCEQKCLEDCNCDAAIFKDQECRKQRLPLRFGRRNNGDSSITLTKVGLSAPFSGNGVTTGIIIKRREVRKDLLMTSISLIVLGVLALAIAVIVLYRSRQLAYTRIINKTRNGELDDVCLWEFSYAELVQITNNFQEELGKGASGTVYKGILPNRQTEVAVKKLEKELAEGEREFQTEMKVIAKTHHRNLVCLLGYCIDGTNRLLVYEFMGNGSLAKILFTTEHQRLSWTERVGIVTDIVKGILYLHEECKTQIIHCDIKPHNILMDENMCAKISDFGLSKHLKQDQTKTYTAVRGTKGYVAPEWFRKLPVTVKADVYSFGILLLEIICHRRNVDWSLPEAEAVLDEWVYDCFVTGELRKLIHDEEVDLKKLERWVKVGIWCIQDEPSLRPSMKKVQLMLEGTVDVPIPPSPSSFLSSI